MVEDSQLRCFVENMNQTHQNITMNMVDDDLIHYSLVVSLTVTVFVLVSNTMLVYGLYKTNKQLSLTKRLFIYLSTVDILATCIGVVSLTIIFYTKNISCLGNVILASIANGLNLFSFEIFLNISILRYLSVIRPFSQIQTSHQRGILLLELIGACSISTAYFFIMKNVTLKSSASIQFATGGVFLIWIGAISTINVLAYKAIHHMLKKRNNRKNKKMDEISMKQHDSRQLTVVLNTSPNENDQRKKAAVVTLIIITVSYLVCNLPITIYAFYSAIQTYRYLTDLELLIDINPIQLVLLLHYIQLLNAGLNATIYILRSKELREFYKSKFVFNA